MSTEREQRAERDKLATVIETAYDLNPGLASFELLAHAILAAGYRKPQQVTTVEDAEPLYRELSKHHPTRGVAVAMGVTCNCGYWTGDEQPGKTRPVGVRGDQLDWHRTQVAISFLAAPCGSL